MLVVVVVLAVAVVTTEVEVYRMLIEKLPEHHSRLEIKRGKRCSLEANWSLILNSFYKTIIFLDLA